MQFSEEYPNKPPLVRFVSKMFHPNGQFHVNTVNSTIHYELYKHVPFMAILPWVVVFQCVDIVLPCSLC